MIDSKTLRKSVQGRKILIDSNIIIYLTEKIEPFYELSRELFSMVEEGRCQAVISVISISEVMQGVIKAGKTEIAEAVRHYLVNFPNSHCQEINLDVLELVGKGQKVNWKKLRTMDSLIIASGLHEQVDLFVSNDLHFSQALPKSMMVSFNATSG